MRKLQCRQTVVASRSTSLVLSRHWGFQILVGQCSFDGRCSCYDIPTDFWTYPHQRNTLTAIDHLIHIHYGRLHFPPRPSPVSSPPLTTSCALMPPAHTCVATAPTPLAIPRAWNPVRTGLPTTIPFHVPLEVTQWRTTPSASTWVGTSDPRSDSCI